MKKRQYSKKVFTVIKSKDTGMVCSLIRRKQKGKPFDVIRFELYPLGEKPIVFNAAPEEALEIAWGMIKATWHFLNEFQPYNIFRSQKSDSKWTDKEIWWS